MFACYKIVCVRGSILSPQKSLRNFMRVPSCGCQLTRAQVLSGLLLALPLTPSPLAAADGVQRSIHRAEGMQRSMDRVEQLLLSEPSLAGTLLRCAFHDCVTRDGGVGGSNGSLRWELSSRENRHIDVGIAALVTIYDAVDGSFADLIAAAGAVAVTQSGGPQITARDLGQGRIDAALHRPLDRRHACLLRPPRLHRGRDRCTLRYVAYTPPPTAAPAAYACTPLPRCHPPGSTSSFPHCTVYNGRATYSTSTRSAACVD